MATLDLDPVGVENAHPDYPFERISAPFREDEVAKEIRSALGNGVAIIPFGGATSLHEGNPTSADRVLGLSTVKLNSGIEFSPADMVVTAGAGMTMEALQAAIRGDNQFVPLDIPLPSRATIGGIVATNGSGLWRPAFGTARDRLLGLRAVLADGSVIKAGGKVVKNVAGYDLCKLFAGSRGTLGVITEATFKTSPLPERSSLHAFESSSISRALDAALQMHRLMLQPAYLIAVHPERILYVGLMGSSETVDWQLQQIERVLSEHGLSRIDPPIDEDTLRHRSFAGDHSLSFRLTVRPTETGRVSDAMIESVADIPVQLTIDVLGGRLDAQIIADTADGRTIRNVITSMSRLRPADAHLFWRRVPADYRLDIPDVWEPRPAGFAIMQQIKKTLDPQGLFSPGRFAGRL